jgi:hypothetical protein
MDTAIIILTLAVAGVYLKGYYDAKRSALKRHPKT